MDQDGNTIESTSVSNNPDGANLLKEKILKLTSGKANCKVLIGMESTSVYSWHPAVFFNEDRELKEVNTSVYVINAKLIKNFKKAYPDINKDDLTDAWVIADRLRFGRVPKTIIASEQYLALQRLTRMRFRVVKMLIKEKQYFLQNLFLKCNAFSSEVDSSAFGKAMMDLFSEKYSLEDIASMDTSELADYLKVKGKNRFQNPEEVAKCIQKAARSSYRLSKCVEDSLDILLATSIECIRNYDKQIKELDKSIEKVIAGIPNTLETIPGIGPVLTAGILAEIGDINRFDNQASLAKYAGLTWDKHQSGDFEADETKLKRTGNRYLRYYLIEAANSVKNREPEFKEYYRKKYAEVSKHNHKRALVLTARKLVRLVDALLRKDQIYTPERKVE